MTPAEKKQFASRVRVEAFERGGCGASVRELPLRKLTPVQAHEELVKRGFIGHRMRIPGPRSHTGAVQFRTPHGTTRTPEEAAHEYAYVHRDGGMVRLYPTCSPNAAYEEVVEGPFARKSVLLANAATMTLADEACVVTETDAAVPKALRPAVGLKYSDEDIVASQALAETILKSHVVRLSTGQEPPIGKTRDDFGLSTGFTVAFEKDYLGHAARLQAALEAHQPQLLARIVQGDTLWFFPGSAPVVHLVLEREMPRAFASLRFHGGTHVISIDAFGFEASVLQLSSFLGAMLDGLECQVFENATGRDLTRLAKRFPYKLLGAEGPILDGET